MTPDEVKLVFLEKAIQIFQDEMGVQGARKDPESVILKGMTELVQQYES